MVTPDSPQALTELIARLRAACAFLRDKDPNWKAGHAPDAASPCIYCAAASRLERVQNGRAVEWPEEPSEEMLRAARAVPSVVTGFDRFSDVETRLIAAIYKAMRAAHLRSLAAKEGGGR